MLSILCVDCTGSCLTFYCRDLISVGTMDGTVVSNWDMTHPLPNWSPTMLPWATKAQTSLYTPVCKSYMYLVRLDVCYVILINAHLCMLV